MLKLHIFNPQMAYLFIRLAAVHLPEILCTVFPLNIGKHHGTSKVAVKIKALHKVVNSRVI